MWEAKGGQMDIVKMLLDAKADHRIVNHLGLTAADWAASRGHADIFNLLFGLDWTFAGKFISSVKMENGLIQFYLNMFLLIQKDS